MTAPRHAAPSLGRRMARSRRYWVWVLAVAVVLLLAAAAALAVAALADAVPPLLRGVLLAAGAWGLLVGLMGARLAQRYRAGEPATP